MTFNTKNDLPNLNTNQVGESEYSFNKNKKTYIIFGIVTLIILFVGSFMLYNNTNDEIDELLILSVDEKPLYYKEYKSYIDFYMQNYQSLDVNNDLSVELTDYENNEIKQKALDKFLKNKAASIILQQKGIKLTPKDYPNLLLGYSFLSYLKKSQTSEIFLEDFAAFEKLKEVYINEVKISDEELETYYNDNKETFNQPAQVNYSIIYIQSSNNKDVLLKVEDLKKEIKNNPNIKFNTLVEKYSEDNTTKKNKGEVGFVNESKLSKAFYNVISNLQPGQISDVFESSGGYFVIKIIDKIPFKEKSFETAKDEVIKIYKPIKARKMLDQDIKAQISKMQLQINQENYNTLKF